LRELHLRRQRCQQREQRGKHSHDQQNSISGETAVEVSLGGPGLGFGIGGGTWLTLSETARYHEVESIRTGGKTKMGPLGWQETVFIFVLALLIFGPKKLPELGRTIGKAITEFRRASTDLKSTFEREMRSMEQETESLREITSSYQNELYKSTGDSYYNYDSYGNYGYGENTSDTSSSSSDSSTVSASAPEGAESTGGAAPDSVETAGGSTSEAGSSGESAIAEGAHEYEQPAQRGAAASESQAVTS